MEQQETPTVQPTEIRSPEKRGRLSDEEMGNLLAAFGNNEAKALTLLLMRSSVIYTKKDIYRTVVDVQGRPPAWKMNREGPFGYCVNSLAPIGLVTKEITDPVLGVYGYEKTDYGERVGDPLAALLLDYSLKHGLSLHQIFGSTVSSSKPLEIDVQGEKGEFKKRSPGTRLKIFWELLTTNLPVREVDLQKRVNENQSKVSLHLRQLKRLAVIDFKSVAPNEPFSSYTLSVNKHEGQPETYKSSPNLTRQIYDLVKSEPSKFWTIEEIFERLRESGKTQDRSLISGVMYHLSKKGYLQTGKFGHDVQSELSLNDGVKEQLLNLVQLIDAFQNQNPQVLERGRELARKFRSGSMEREIAKLMQKAKENSPDANKLPTEDTGLILLSIIQQVPSKKTSEIRDILERQYDRKLSTGTVLVLLSSLRSRGLIVGDKTGPGIPIRWAVNPQALKEAKLAEQTLVEVREKMGL